MPFSLKIFSEITFALPDILSSFSLVLLIMLRTLIGEKYSRIIFPKLAILLSLVCLFVTFAYTTIDKDFDTALFSCKKSLLYMKSVLLVLSAIAFILLKCSNRVANLSSSLYFLIFALVNSIIICLSANNFIILVLGLELYTISVSFLLLIEKVNTGRRKNVLRFILTSSVMTAVLLYGMSLYYSQFGTFSFSRINLTNSFASIVGTVLIICALLFKVGAAPFHSWMVDMYERAPTALVLFLDAIWKFFMVFVFIRVFAIIITGETNHYQLVLYVISILSMVIGSVMPILQKNIKKFIAFASVGHIGFITTTFATVTSLHKTSVVMEYMAFYGISSICFFSTILLLKGVRKVELFKDLSGLMRENKILGVCILLSLFSMIGIPPFALFAAKFNILKSLVQTGNIPLLVVSIIYSIITLFYCAKASRYLFKQSRFNAPTQRIVTWNILASFNIVLLLSLIFFHNIVSSWFSKIIGNL